MIASHNPEKGFTIIELIIVFAMGGLILMLVLQAVPMLMRNSRNSQRKQDVAAILQGVSRFQLNNSGRYPDDGADKTTILQQYTKVSYYLTSNIAFEQQNSYVSGTLPGITDVDKIEIRHYYKCDVNGQSTSKGAGYRDVVARYAIESRGGSSPQCQQL